VTALVLGGGGMFGAYEAGAWETLQPHFRPDLIIGASIGAINACVCASGAPASEWIETWLDFREAASSRFRIPRSLTGGCIETERFERFVQDHYLRFQPAIPMGVVVTDLLRLTPRTVFTPDLTWKHIAASCAVPVIMPQYRIDGRIYADGGLLGALPLFAAYESGARLIVAINILPRTAPWPLRVARRALHALSPHRPTGSGEATVIVIEPQTALGSVRDTALWSAERSSAYVQRGREDAGCMLPLILQALTAARNNWTQPCFERE
jgi:NTE family protein